MKKIILLFILWLVFLGCSPSHSVSGEQTYPAASISKKPLQNPIAPVVSPSVPKLPLPPPPVASSPPLSPTALPPSGDLIVLNYHSVKNSSNELSVSPVLFEKEMNHLKRAGYTFIGTTELEEWKSGQLHILKPIMITLDDGYSDNYQFAYPILKRTGTKSVIFVITEWVGGPDFLTWDQIKEMQASGLVEFGAHTKTHPHLPTLVPPIINAEISDSKRELEQEIGHEVILFAYPYGEYNQVSIDSVQNTGFHFAFSTKQGKTYQNQGFYTLHRIYIPGNMSLSTFEKKFP